MSRDSILEIQHKREQSHDSGTYQDWTLEETFPQHQGQGKPGDFVTVVAVDEKPFVTVLSVDSSPPDSEEVLVYRLPGERLGFGLKFEGGVKTAEKVKKLLIQSCADDSPASRTRASWGPLSPGDEIIVIDSVPVTEMTRIDCVRALKESNVVIKLRVRKASSVSMTKEEDKEPPPIIPRKHPRKKDLMHTGPPPAYPHPSPPYPQSTPQVVPQTALPIALTSTSQHHSGHPYPHTTPAAPHVAPSEDLKNSPPIVPRSRQIPQAETYTDLISQENVLPTESESDDTGSSISTVVSRISSTPTTCNSSFSDAKSTNSVDFGSPSPGGKQSAYDLDKVLEPFLHLEREFSSVTIDENNIFHKLAEATNLLEKPKEEKAKEEDVNSGPPRPAPRQERRRPPPPPPPPRAGRHQVFPETRHLPRLIDFVPKDRTDVVVPSPLVPQTTLSPPPKPVEDVHQKIVETKEIEQIKEEPDGAVDFKKSVMDNTEYHPKQSSPCQKDCFPPCYSRLPPDGREFDAPPVSQKLTTDLTKTASPPFKDFKPKSSFDPKKVPVEASKYSWRNDEKSERSVKDKIAMFSNAQNNPLQNHTVKFCRKLSLSKSSEQESKLNNFSSERQVNEKNDVLNSKLHVKKGDLPYQSLCDVSASFDYKNSYQNDEKTRSTFDLTENSPSASVSLNKEFLTLPRKGSHFPKHSFEQKNNTSGNTLSRAFSFSGESKLHNRSQSLIDVGSSTQVCKIPMFSKQDDLRRSSLVALTEQRKKNYSKLRGLVIPEKVVEVPSLVVDDLPVIKSTDCLIESNIDEGRSNLIKSETDKLTATQSNNNKLTADKGSVLIPSPLWKTENNYDIPKYSPAFKRKSLSLYGTSSSVSSVSSSLSSSREELRTCFYEPPKTLSNANMNISKSLANLTRNPLSAQSEPKSLESITSPSISDLSYDFGHESVSPNLNACHEDLSQFKYNEGYGSDTQRSKAEEHAEDESDNDSAVSSSRSSISPPHSPVSEAKKNENSTPSPKCHGRFDLKLKRTLSSETTASNSSNGSTLTSGSQASCSSSGTTSSKENKRVLKAQSVEAINRKNVLSSARFSSGINTEIKTDLKNEISLSDEVKQSEKEVFKHKSGPMPKDVTDNYEKEDNCLQFTTSSPVNTVISENSSSPFESYNSSLEAESLKESNLTNELIKGETSFNIDNFTYSSKDVDKNSNMKISDFNDLNDGITPPRWPIDNQPSDYISANKPQKSVPPIETSKSYEKQNNDLPSSKTINVNNMKKVFEKVDNGGPYLPNTRFKLNQNSIQHPRVSSVDSTNSDDSCVPNPSHYGSASNLLREQQFGSITSLASSTSLISQQELSQLIEEANHTLEDEGNTHEVVVVILHRDIPGGSIGITLAGGADYEAKEITVHKVLIGSPAERDGRIQKGDRILSINGKSMKGLTHYESLAILKAPRPEVVLVVSRHRGDTPEDGSNSKSAAYARMNKYLESKAMNQTKGKDQKWGPSIVVKLLKDGAGLGFSLEGGRDSPYGDLPLTIKKIFTGGCADKSGNLFAGDELLSVNNTDVSELSRIEAWSLMKRLPDGEVVLIVRHPFA